MSKPISVDVEVTKLGDVNLAIIRFPEEMKVLGSTLRNGGYIKTDCVLMMQVPLGYDGDDPEKELEEMVAELGLPENTVCFMTAADIRKVITTAEAEFNGVRAIAIATSGVKNAVIAGDLLPESVLAEINKQGTINIVVVVNTPLDPAGMANAIMTVTEAKAAALMDVGVRGTGTTSDAVAVVSPKGNGTKFVGTATDAGIAVARSVRKAVAESTRKWYNGTPVPDMIQRLAAKGITMEVMWETAKELYYPNSAWDTEDLHRRFVEHIQLLNDDVNVVSMVHAAMLIEEAGFRDEIHALRPGEFQTDPMHLVCDEMMGIALAEYISGTRGLFEYTRYDKKKPGILKTLGPFLDDIVGSLIGATMSKIYTDLLGAGR